MKITIIAEKECRFGSFHSPKGKALMKPSVTQEELGVQ